MYASCFSFFPVPGESLKPKIVALGRQTPPLHGPFSLLPAQKSPQLHPSQHAWQPIPPAAEGDTSCVVSVLIKNLGTYWMRTKHTHRKVQIMIQIAQSDAGNQHVEWPLPASAPTVKHFDLQRAAGQANGSCRCTLVFLHTSALDAHWVQEKNISLWIRPQPPHSSKWTANFRAEHLCDLCFHRSMEMLFCLYLSTTNPC